MCNKSYFLVSFVHSLLFLTKFYTTNCEENVLLPLSFFLVFVTLFFFFSPPLHSPIFLFSSFTYGFYEKKKNVMYIAQILNSFVYTFLFTIVYSIFHFFHFSCYHLLLIRKEIFIRCFICSCANHCNQMSISKKKAQSGFVTCPTSARKQRIRKVVLVNYLFFFCSFFLAFLLFQRRK